MIADRLMISSGFIHRNFVSNTPLHAGEPVQALDEIEYLLQIKGAVREGTYLLCNNI